jgi:hypothetical protein
VSTTSNESTAAASLATAKPLLTGPKRQHFLPRFYLENFSANGLIAVYDREQCLSEYEGKAKPVIDKLAAREAINGDERTDLAIFIALAAMRTPDVVDSLQAFNADMVTDIMMGTFHDMDEVVARLRDGQCGAGTLAQSGAAALNRAFDKLVVRSNPPNA